MSQAPSIPNGFTVQPALLRLDTVTPIRRSGLRFGLFVLLTAIIFIRPTDLVPDLRGLPIYECVIVLCAITSFPVLARQLRWRTLSAQPWTLCVIGLLPAIVLADLSHGNTYGARTNAFEFLKILVYYLLLVGLVDSPDRLRKFLFAVALFVTIIATLAVLQYHGIIDLPALQAMVQNAGDDPETGETATLIRLLGTGIFSDPNDFSLVLSASVLIGLYWIIDQKNWLIRIVWLHLIAMLLYAFTLTRSRGGFLALMAGLAVLFISRFGGRRSVLIGSIVFPLALLVFAGRQTSIDISDTNDTGQGRIHLWRDSMALFKASPIFGIGVGQLAEANDLVAHNSYVHSLAELGILGGTLFIGAWYVLLAAVLHRGPSIPLVPNCSKTAALRPYVLGMLASYGIGLHSLTRCYVVSTYLVLGAGGVMATLLSLNLPAERRMDFSGRLCARVVLVAAGAAVFLDIFVRVFAT